LAVVCDNVIQVSMPHF